MLGKYIVTHKENNYLCDFYLIIDSSERYFRFYHKELIYSAVYVATLLHTLDFLIRE